MRRVWFGLCLSFVAMCASANENQKRENSDRLQQVLQAEADGTAVDRRALLGHDAEQSHSARWQTGQFKHQGVWVDFESLSDSQESSTLQRYHEQRSLFSADIEGHRRLALWCLSHHLDAQAKAHWHAVLSFSPDDQQARNALNHASIDGHWFTPDERQRVTDASRRIEAEWTTWMPRLQKIVDDLSSPSTERTRRGLAALEKIDDRAAVSSLEITCEQLRDDHALPFVQAIGRIPSQEACLACCRIAMQRQGERTGALALKQVKAYPQELYVPELLSLLREPTQTEVEYQFTAKGELLIHRALFQETMNERHAVKLERLVRVNAPVSYVQSVRRLGGWVPGIDVQASAISSDIAAPSQIAADEIAASRDALEEQQQFDQRIAQANITLQQANRKVYGLLAKTTDQALPETPGAWWAWWVEANVRSSSRKPLHESHYSYIDEPRVEVAYAVGAPEHECLTRGTLVQTGSGLRPIETIQVGDLVLSQNVESGELCLKPVLQTTIRPPLTTLRIVSESGEIQATAGHRWFVSGKGWLMTKELKADMLLHNASGTSRIVELKEDLREQETFNLVVDEFHTYFVGSERVLSYDNSELKPTLRAVPGYGQIALK